MKIVPRIPFLLSCAAIALPPLAAQELPAPEVSARAGSGLKENTVTAAAGDVTATESDAPSDGVSGTTTAKAKVGTLSARVDCADSSEGEFMRGYTTNSWRDTMTINASGRAGQRGIATLNFRVKGSPIFQTSDGGGQVEVGASAAVNTLNGGQEELRVGTTFFSDGSLGDDYRGKVQSFDFRFTYGEPFSVSGIMTTYANTSSPGLGFVGINVEWNWLGLTNFRTWDGSDPDSAKSVLNATVKSESKTNFLRPIGVNYPTVTILSDLNQFTEKPAQTGTITLRLNKPAPSRVRIDLAYSGKATRGSDYTTTKPSYVIIEKGVSEATFTIKSLNDTLVESPETLSIRVLPGISYGLGTSRIADLTILSDE